MSHKVAFGEWEQQGPGIRVRVAHAAGTRWAVVEYAPGAGRAEFCTDGHRGYVLAGAIEYELADGGTVSFARGDGILLDAGEPGHRGVNRGGEPALLFLIDD